MKEIPVNRKDMIVGNKYYTCNYSGAISVILVKIFKDRDACLVKIKNCKYNPFVREIKYIFDNPSSANRATKDWENNNRKKKRK